MYWALTYEAANRNEDALNAAASALETATKVESPYPVTTVYSILTRCYLRKNMPEDAEKAFAKMDELYEKHSKDASLGIQGIVARTQGFRSAWAGKWMEADLAYATAIDLFARFMKIHEVEARRDYGEWLTKQGRWGEARKQLEKAIDIYKKLGNEAGVEATNALMHALSQK
jgi:pentatricopeptide repeat protein